MSSRHRRIGWLPWLVLLLIHFGSPAYSQTQPTPQTLPFVATFGTSSFSSLPVGLASWGGLDGDAVSTSTLAAASNPTSDASVTAVSAAQSTGGSYGYAAGGNGRFYVQTSGNATNGANQLVLALNTSGLANLSLAYDVEIISAQPRTVGVLCQYRTGTSGAWTTLSASQGQNPFSQAAGTTGTKTSPVITLPPGAENQPLVQVRWATWRGTEGGNSSGIAIDNISVTGQGNSISLAAGVSPTQVVENAGSAAAQLTITRTGGTASALPVTILSSDSSEAVYSGTNPVVIPAGQTTVTVPIDAIDDDGFDGTQLVTLSGTAPGAIQGSCTLSVLDNEDSYAPPIGYYNSVTNVSGTTLKGALKVIASPVGYTQLTYSGVLNALRALHQDPNNTANVITVYSGSSVAKNNVYFVGNDPDTSWSREHCWPDSYGLDPTNINPATSGSDAGADFTDLFNLRPCLQTVNAERSNRIYDFTSGTPTVPPLAPECSYDSNSFQPRPVERGDLARGIFYMAMRYDGSDPLTIDLEVANTANSAIGQFGGLSTLLRWNEEDPVSTEERARNQAIYANWQHNRNPFIDHPEYIYRIWGYIRQSAYAATLTEGGTATTYQMTLASQPTSNVTVTLSTTSTNQITLSATSFTFTPSNWDQPQVVTVSTVDDSIYEATGTARVVHVVSSADPRYAAFLPFDFVATVLDNDPQFPATSLPISFGGPWGPLPIGFSGLALSATYSSSLGGDTSPGSAKFDTAGNQMLVSFNSAPGTLTYQLKGNPSAGSATSGTFVIQESPDGITFNPLRTVVNKDNTDQAYTDALSPFSRFVAFVYVQRTGGNVQLDKLAITSAAPFVAWASGYGLSGADANPGADPDGDGIPNLAEYGLNQSATVRDAVSTPASQVSGRLRITAVVRKNDAKLGVVAQTTSNLANPASWTTAGVTQITPVDQTGVPGGFERVTFERTDSTAPAYFRLVFTLAP